MDVGIVEQVLWHIHNRFGRDSTTVSGCEVSGGQLPASVPIPDGAWYWVDGSLFNDGLHVHPATDLTDETFDGTITLCAIPKALLAVCDEIEQWVADYNEGASKALSSPYASESFGGYTYSTKTGVGSQNGSAGLTGWQAEFASRLNPWRKIA